MPAAADVGIILSVGTVGTVSELVKSFRSNYFRDYRWDYFRLSMW